jgi:4-alpha-glucanotransferase
MYNQLGQDWSQPPWRPDALAEAAFIPYRDMLRTVLGHAGGLRIDHVLGLFRLWWVPQGFPAYAGTFVRFDYDAMLSILMLEAHRAGALVVGEDLGTVEPWVQQVLAERGILGTSILWFEAEAGAIKDPDVWRRDVLASVTVHDLPPTAGFLRDEHVRIRADLGLLTTPEAEERENAARERHAWADVLRRHDWLGWDVDLDTDDGLDELVVALHRAVAGSPARLVGISLPDVVGDRRAQNQPGTDQEYPNWRVPMTDASGRPVTLEELIAGTDLLRRIMGAVR